MLPRVVWWKMTVASEVLAASIVRARTHSAITQKTSVYCGLA